MNVGLTFLCLSFWILYLSSLLRPSKRFLKISCLPFLVILVRRMGPQKLTTAGSRNVCKTLGRHGSKANHYLQETFNIPFSLSHYTTMYARLPGCQAVRPLSLSHTSHVRSASEKSLLPILKMLMITHPRTARHNVFPGANPLSHDSCFFFLNSFIAV